MPNNEKVVLVGMPGSGKSTVGKVLAAALNAEFLDLDSAIEDKAGKEINLIFQEEGEAYFRTLEQKCLHKALAISNKLVLSTGGGVPCFFDNLDKINEVGTSVYINVSVEQIVERLKDDSSRPLLSGNDAKAKLLNLYENRKVFYRKSSITIDADNMIPTAIVENIMKQIKT